ncbi:MAG: CehA/McbA family metallohydrolase [Candidatus Hydrogenedentes bacterium]|nr:CehA/McbA family metallohydrolase [Candidatus Hydrogenedentota bacterium]
MRINLCRSALFSVLVFTLLAHADDEALPGAPEFAGALAQYSAYVLPEAGRAQADGINRALREAQDLAKRATTDVEKQTAAEKRLAAVGQLQQLLASGPKVIEVQVEDKQATLAPAPPMNMAAETGALLFRVTTGAGPERAITADFDLSDHSSPRLRVQVAPGCVTWVLVTLNRVPTLTTHVEIEFSAGGGPTTILPMTLTTPDRGTLEVTILSDDSGKPTPAMVRLERKLDGRHFGPSNALDFGPQFDHQGNFAPQRRTNNVGSAGGSFWVCPGPFTMQLAPGAYTIVVARGTEHEAVSEEVTVASNKTTARTVRPRRWIDMRKRGWWSGDDHFHCQILSDADAERAMRWAQAEDVHLCNVVKMGDISRTWFDQRGFGAAYRVMDADYILSPGQECPRTHNELGHTIHMNIRNMIRDTSRYYLYDTVFDEVQDQGGLSGYCHVNSGIFHVHRDMTMNVPKGKVDFVELLQFANLGTDIYYDFLNTGFKVTASAGSDVPWGGSVGEVRLYAYLGRKRFTADNWFAAVGEGHTFVTNGIMLDLRVEKAIPGDTITVTDDKPLRVRATAIGDPRRGVPAKLDVIVHGDSYKHAESTDPEQKELSLSFTIPAGNGFWIAARAEGSDGSRAHTTPIYVVREGLRFWKYDAVPALIEKRLASLAEIEQIVTDAQTRDAAGQVDDNRAIKQLAIQGPALLERVKAANELYDELTRVAEAEREARTRQ